MAPDDPLHLIEPSLDLRAEFESYCRDFDGEGEIPGLGSMLTSPDFPTAVGNCLDHARGRNLPDGWVPAHTLWLVRHDDRAILGMISLRHALTPWLESQGGHVGYSVRPAFRRQGLATLMLAGILPLARSLGLPRLLITCDKNNTASARTILKAGGTLYDELPSTTPGRQWTQRYWLPVPPEPRTVS